jgi:DNA ligase (NAD+)
VEHFSVARGAGKVEAAIATFRKTRDSLAFPTDGAVVKLDAVAPRSDLGETDRAPRWAIAYKFAPERVTTRVRAITIQVGRSGVLTPVAELEPVALAGSTISRATLHNRDALARADVRVGDFVFIEKAGEIIPAIVGVDLARRGADVAPYVFPTSCPACGATVVAVEGAVAVRCPNSECGAQIRRRLEHFASKECLDIDGLGAATIDALVQHDCVKTIADLFRVRRDDLMTVGGVGQSTAKNLLAAIERGKRAELWRFIYGLGIPRVGAATARDLARAFGDLAALEHARAEDFAPGGRAAAAGIGDATARAIAAYFAAPKNRAIVEDLIAAGITPESSGSAVSPLARIAGKVFVLTGKLPTLTREQATSRIESAGGIVRTSVSRATNYVVAGADPGSKLEQARAAGVTIIDEDELLRMLAAR